ncbi:macro domain-containing protein [Aeromonas caviae]
MTNSITTFEIILGDITKANVDVIVNSAKPTLTGGSGVDGAIHKAAGASVLKECLDFELIEGIRCPTGCARITNAGNLNSKFIIHTVGPIYEDCEFPDKLLTLAYVNSIELAIKFGCKSIAFPAISCGKYGYPHEEAVRIAFSTLHYYLGGGIKVYFYLFEKELYGKYLKELEKY